MCWERSRPTLLSRSRAGSSPRVRGTDDERDGLLPALRFIPACAGNGARCGTPASGPPVHPRVCGERGLPALLTPLLIGSSPRVRGTGAAQPGRLGRGRFIPACAGNGASRARGEMLCYGSSPRVRGTEDGTGLSVAILRFIPACAGNGRETARGSKRETVHPRVCGERDGHRLKSLRFTGSSPRVRGTALPRPTGMAHNRFIPACAGNGTTGRDPRAESPVHPRVCGERQFLQGFISLFSGSSPRVRGTGVRHDLHG